MLLSVGSMAIPETPICGRWSVSGDQLTPLSMDFHNPPAGAPT